MNKPLMTAVTAGLIAVSTPVSADDDDHYCRLKPGQTVLSQDQIRQRLAATGRKVQRIKMDDGCYEVHLTDAKGARYEAYVNPATGVIIRSKRDD